MDELLLKKLEYFKSIRKITASYDFKGAHEESDAYISMINKREYILDKISEIDKRLLKMGKEEIINNSPIQKQIRDVIKEITEMDEKNKLMAEKIKNDLLLKINDIKKGKKISNAYNQFTEISGFDLKR